MTTSEDDYLLKIDEAFVKAAKIMDLEDVFADDGEEIDDEEITNINEERHHCGTCQVRTVMEVVWPAIEDYIDALKAKAIPIDDFTLPTPLACLHFAYAALKDGKNPDLATAWATLGKTITVAVSATRTMDVAMAANRYMLNETEENKEVLLHMLAKWNELP